MPVNVNIPIWPCLRFAGPSGDFATCVIFKTQWRDKTPVCGDVQDAGPPASHSCRPAPGNQGQKRFAEARGAQLQDHCLQRRAVGRVRAGKRHDDQDFRAFASHQGHSGAALARTARDVEFFLIRRRDHDHAYRFPRRWQRPGAHQAEICPDFLKI